MQYPTRRLFHNYFLIIVCVCFTPSEECVSIKTGTCFRTRRANGKCSEPIGPNFTRERCCQHSRGNYFTYENYQNWFMWSIRSNGGVGNCTTSCPNSGCDGINCRENQVCELRERNYPVCVCNVNCDIQSLRPRRLCANNGQTFNNECDLKRWKCKYNSHVTKILHYGSCNDDARTCRPGRCPTGKVCILKQDGTATCQIRIWRCGRSSRDTTFCGSNGITYHSRCLAIKAGQRRGREITLRTGACID